jgi:hypothetical protein
VQKGTTSEEKKNPQYELNSQGVKENPAAEKKTPLGGKKKTPKVS